MFDKLKKLFVVEDEELRKKAAEEAASKATSGTEPTNQSVRTKDVSAEPIVPLSGAPDQKFIEILLKAIEKANLDGFDYLEFKQSLQSLSSVSMDEGTRYKSALAMAKTMGGDTDKLIKSADHYISILREEQGKFQEAVRGQKAKLQQDKDQGITSLQKSITEKQKQIESLQKQIEEEKASLSKMEENINQSADKINNTTSQFEYAYQLVNKQIVEDVTNIKKYMNQ